MCDVSDILYRFDIPGGLSSPDYVAVLRPRGEDVATPPPPHVRFLFRLETFVRVRDGGRLGGWGMGRAIDWAISRADHGSFFADLRKHTDFVCFLFFETIVARGKRRVVGVSRRLKTKMDGESGDGSWW